MKKKITGTVTLHYIPGWDGPEPFWDAAIIGGEWLGEFASEAEATAAAKSAGATDVNILAGGRPR